VAAYTGGFMFIHTRNGTILGDVHEHCANQNHLIREQHLMIPQNMYLNFHQHPGIFLGSSPYAPWDYVGVKTGEDFLGIVLGAPGSHKTTAIAIPSLSTFRGSIIALDIKPKGKMLPIWQSFKQRNGKPLLIFNPMNPDSWGYNPLLILKLSDGKNKVQHAKEIALSILSTISEDRDKVWRRTAQLYLSAVILYCFDLGAAFTTIMVALQVEPITKMLKLIMNSDNILAKMQVTHISETDAKVINNIGMDIAELSVFATDPNIMSVLSEENEENLINWDYFNRSTRAFDVIIQIPEELLEQWSPLTSLIFNQLTRILEMREEKIDSKLPPMLVMIDEFGKIGKVSSFLSGLTTLRSRGVSYLLFIQYLSQLKIYGSDAISAFMGCTTHKIILDVGDADERNYISKLIGDVEVCDWSKTASCNPQGFVNGYSQQLSMVRKPLLFPEELGRLKDVILIHRDGVSRIPKTPYFSERFLQYFQPVNHIPSADYPY
jgi:type IV secretion system protein VirD4